MDIVAYVLTHDDLVEKLRQQLGFLDRSAALFDEGHEDEAVRLAQIMRVLFHDTSSSHSLLGQLGVKETLSYLDTSEPIHPQNLLPTMGLVTARFESGPLGTVGSYVAPLGSDPPESRKVAHSRSRKKQKRRRARPPTPASDKAIFYIRGAFASDRPLPPPDPPPYSRQKPFAEWWNEAVTKDGQNSFFARRNYVLAGAHKEGGAHVDPALDAEWAGLTRRNTLKLRVTMGGIEIVVGEAAEAVEVDLGNPALASIRQIAYEVDQTLRSQLGRLL